MEDGLSLGQGVLWVLIWLGWMLLHTVLDVAVWRRFPPVWEKYLNTVAITVSMAAFLGLLSRENHFEIDLFRNLSIPGILGAAGCAILLYLLLDQGLDPVLEKAFPASEASYQETLRTLRQSPGISLIQVCVLAPVIEEILMRGYLLQGLSVRYGSAVALAVSSLLFALLHFNMVQTLSALICGLALGLLYGRTGSVFCCILTHAGYNLISYGMTVLPLRGQTRGEGGRAA